VRPAAVGYAALQPQPRLAARAPALKAAGRVAPFVALAGDPSGPVLTADATVAKALATGEPWILVTEEGSGRPRGWVGAARLGGLPEGGTLAALAPDGIGHSFTAGTDSLRAALDAAVLSPAGQAVAVDGDGRTLGVATFDQLRAAIAADPGRGPRP